MLQSVTLTCVISRSLHALTLIQFRLGNAGVGCKLGVCLFWHPVLQTANRQVHRQKSSRKVRPCQAPEQMSE